MDGTAPTALSHEKREAHDAHEATITIGFVSFVGLVLFVESAAPVASLLADGSVVFHSIHRAIRRWVLGGGVGS